MKSYKIAGIQNAFDTLVWIFTNFTILPITYQNSIETIR
jgi:hypothetical protein